MNKELFEAMIATGFIRGHSNKGVLYFNGRNMHCDFISDDNSLICKTVVEKYNDGNNFIGDKKIGLPDLNSFLKMLKTLGKSINIKVLIEDRNDKFLLLDDDTIQMRYGLIAESRLPKIPNIKTESLSTTPCQVFIDSEFIKKFYKLSGAVKDCKYLFVNTDDENLYMTISQSENYLTGVKISVPLLDSPGMGDKVLKFDIKKFRLMLYNNRNMDGGRLQFHGGGIANAQFFADGIKTTYFVVAE